MTEQNVLYGGVEELNKIRKILEEQADVKKQIETVTAQKKALETDLEAEEKAVQAAIDVTVKRRREQVVSTFDKELTTAQDKMKDARDSKDKEKTKKVNKRIDKETSSLVRENKVLIEDKKTYLKQKNISSIWDKPLTYIMYFPKSIIEILEFLLIFVIFFIGVPVLVTKLTSLHIIWEVIIFIAIDALFVIIYMMGYEVTRMQNKESFLELYKKRKEISKNNKKIKKIKKKILKDRDESRYDLGKYDEDINAIEDRINDIVNRKNEALSEFEKTTKSEIANEIKGKSKDKIEKLKTDLEKANTDLKTFDEKQKDITLNLTTNYGPYIGNENLNVRKIDAMIDAINAGQAKNVSEAASVVNQTQG